MVIRWLQGQAVCLLLEPACGEFLTASGVLIRGHILNRTKIVSKNREIPGIQVFVYTVGPIFAMVSRNSMDIREFNGACDFRFLLCAVNRSENRVRSVGAFLLLKKTSCWFGLCCIVNLYIVPSGPLVEESDRDKNTFTLCCRHRPSTSSVTGRQAKRGT